MENTVTESAAVETQTVDIPMFDCIFSKRGKGAKGVYTLQTYGKPAVLENGVTRELSYFHAKGMEIDTILAIVEMEQVGTLAELVLEAIDAKKRENNGQGNLEEKIVRRLLSEGLEVSEDKAKVQAKSIAITLNGMAEMGEGISLDEYFAKRKAIIATQRSLTGVQMPRLVDNRK